MVVLTLESLPGSDPQGQGLKLGKEEEGPQLGRRWREGAGVGGELKTNTGAGAPVPALWLPASLWAGSSQKAVRISL